MAQAGDFYTVTLKKAHLEWGTHRYTNSRGKVYGEGYIKIPSDAAYSFGLLNSNGTSYKDIFGQNLFYCKSKDGLYEGILRAHRTVGAHCRAVCGIFLFTVQSFGTFARRKSRSKSRLTTSLTTLVEISYIEAWLSLVERCVREHRTVGALG